MFFILVLRRNHTISQGNKFTISNIFSADRKTWTPSVDFNNNGSPVYAMVFFGRKAQTSILLRYLEKNVKENGGILDKILFCVRTKNQDDLDYLDTIMSQNKSYFETLRFKPNLPYSDIYENVKDDDLVFKIDDDIVFISDGTFEKMYEEYVTKDLLFLSANVVNHPLLSYAHARIKAILPFVEVKNYTWKLSENLATLAHTAVFQNTYDAFSQWWRNPKSAAIAHESFLYHMERDNIDAYNFRYWDFHSEKYYRWSINFVLMRGKYVNKISKNYPKKRDDELLISQVLPELHKRNCYALGSAVVSHFSYYIQYNYMKNTNLLQRYDDLSKKYLKKQ